MNGNEAAVIVGLMCKKKRHQASSASSEAFVVCSDCRDVMEALRAKHRDDTPPLPTVSVHFVVDGTGGNVGSDLVSTYRDEVAAHRHAQEIRGFVVSWPVSADYRKADG